MRAHQAIALRVAVVTCGSEAEEAVQDAFMKAWRALGRFRPGSPFRPWLLTIVANEARNRRRGAGRRAAVTLRAQAMAIPAGPASPEEAVVDQVDLDRVLAEVARLPERERLAIGYRHLAGLSERETAAALGVRPGTVKSRVARGLSRLRDALDDDQKGTA